MIRLADTDNLKAIDAFCAKHPPLGIKIAALCRCYGLGIKFMDVWLQYSGDRVSSVIMKLENFLTVSASPDSDTEELFAFAHMLGYGGMETNIDLKHSEQRQLRLHSMKFARKIAGFCTDRYKINLSPELKDIYGIMERCRDKHFEPPPFDGFCADMSHRIRHDAGFCVVVLDKDKPAACALIEAKTKNSALVGGVACLPDVRHCGLGSAAVLAAIEHFSGTEVFAVCTGGNKEFYRKLRFREAGYVYLYEGDD